MILKYLKKFPDDRSLEKLHISLNDGDYEAAGYSANTLKGLCSTLGFPEITGKVAVLYNRLRDGIYENTERYLDEIKVLYTQLIEWIALID